MADGAIPEGARTRATKKRNTTATKGTTGGSAPEGRARGMGGYWALSRNWANSLLMIVPLLLVYEVGILFVHGPEKGLRPLGKRVVDVFPDQTVFTVLSIPEKVYILNDPESSLV